ncbi:nucleotidyltransferase domain-containing protein [Flammeovirga yaeyamensis]|uniref:Nucleotidyltransferase domain-containing protein n=1 Tax=Flammeovirga yaeyamensis TaxID=367791 RepID=A0AAX1NBL4_9BACT|nr:nucleotidyltransferase domain-containing protein [Flammeovirga yaeyamensis]MBB3697226.1 hypothetical protein [Flammeovirga yaeyamensis]NMF33885.1 nucleotidyltransferase domain-containing protein [Flammeovirga yaeyamensis]QWG04855.1 nucleotidyltransferase domain-containing protein [Flammeovirga yaeyamensis]
MNKELLRYIDPFKELCKKHRLEKVYLFGSQATENYSEDSDIDLLIKFSDKIDVIDYADYYFNFLEDVENLFNKKVDLVSEKSLSNKYFIDEINRTKLSLYES